MLIISVSLDKISADTFPGLRKWIEELNAIRETPVEIVMAVEDDNVMGIMVFEPGHLIYLFVPKEVRRSGVGTYLLKYLVNLSDRKVVHCKVAPTAIEAICFFHQLGWQIERWYIALDNRRYFRMTNAVPHSPQTSPEEEHLEQFVSNVPIFLSVAGGIS